MTSRVVKISWRRNGFLTSRFSVRSISRPPRGSWRPRTGRRWSSSTSRKWYDLKQPGTYLLTMKFTQGGLFDSERNLYTEYLEIAR